MIATSKRSSQMLAKLSAYCGIVAPPLMVALWSLASFLRPGYNQLTQRGSELGTGQAAIVMNVNFAITGVLIMIFALGLGRSIHGSKWSRIGPVFLLICGVGEAMTGAFPCDPGCRAATGSFSQNVHLGTAVVFFGSISITPFLVGIGLSRSQSWKFYRSYSIASGLASIVLFFVFSIAVLSSFQYVGLVQRLFLAVPFLWIESMAIRALNVSS